MRLPSTSRGQYPRRDLWDTVSQRLVPVPLVNVTSSNNSDTHRELGMSQESVRRQVALFIVPSNLDVPERITIYAWDGVSREEDGALSLRYSYLYLNERSRSQGERSMGDFFAIAAAMWSAARDQDRPAFEKARLSFRNTDMFSGLPAEQLTAMAGLLEKHGFSASQKESTTNRVRSTHD